VRNSLSRGSGIPGLLLCRSSTPFSLPHCRWAFCTEPATPTHPSCFHLTLSTSNSSSSPSGTRSDGSRRSTVRDNARGSTHGRRGWRGGEVAGLQPDPPTVDHTRRGQSRRRSSSIPLWAALSTAAVRKSLPRRQRRQLHRWARQHSAAHRSLALLSRSGPFPQP